MYIRSKTVKGKTYLQLVESQWIDGRSKQIVLKSLGRLDTLRETGQLDGLLRSGIKFSERLAVLDAHEQGKSIKTESRRIGLSLIFEKLWQDLKIAKVIKGLLSERKYEFSVERAIHDEVNTWRTGIVHNELGYSAQISRIARNHSQDMVDRNFFDHESPEGSGPEVRFQGTRFRCSENILTLPSDDLTTW